MSRSGGARVTSEQVAATNGGGGRAELAYALIKRGIITCELAPGAQVTEESLAERYEVNRSAVRPAVKRLLQEQLVQLATPKRYTVTPITLKHAQDLFALRLLLEPEAARLAANRVTPEALERLRQLSEATYQPGDRGSAEQFLRANADFHNTVARASGNEMMAEMISTLLERTERLNHLAHMLEDRNEAAYHEHHELVAALAAGDGEDASRIMAEQIADTRAFVISALLASPSLQAVNVTGPAPGSSPAR